MKNVLLNDNKASLQTQLFWQQSLSEFEATNSNLANDFTTNKLTLNDDGSCKKKNCSYSL